MKKLFSALIPIIATVALNASAMPVPPIHGPLTFTWTVMQTKLQSSPKYAGQGLTNITGAGANKATNILQVYKDSFTTTPFNSASLIALFAHSLNTTFPAGSKVVLAGDLVFVADSTGANGTDVSAVFKVTTTNKVMSGMDTQIRTTKGTNNTTATSGSGSGSQVVIISYDDSANPPADDQVTTFTFIGEGTFSETASSLITDNNTQITEKSKTTVTVKGVGYGTIRNVPSNISGSISGTISGTEIITIP